MLWTDNSFVATFWSQEQSFTHSFSITCLPFWNIAQAKFYVIFYQIYKLLTSFSIFFFDNPNVYWLRIFDRRFVYSLYYEVMASSVCDLDIFDFWLTSFLLLSIPLLPSNWHSLSNSKLCKPKCLSIKYQKNNFFSKLLLIIWFFDFKLQNIYSFLNYLRLQYQLRFVLTISKLFSLYFCDEPISIKSLVQKILRKQTCIMMKC